MDGILAAITSLSGTDADLKQLNSTLLSQENLLKSAAVAARQAMAATMAPETCPGAVPLPTGTPSQEEEKKAEDSTPPGPTDEQKQQPPPDPQPAGGAEAGLIDLLASLDVIQHTLGMLHLLIALGTDIGPEAREAADLFVSHATPFLLSADQYQIAFAPQNFVTLCHKYTDACVICGTPMRGVRALRSACQLLGPTPNSLTPVHTDFLKVCLLARCYSQAARWLDEHPILEICPKGLGLTSVDYLTFFHRAGLVYTGLKRYEDALEAFQLAVTAPATCVSAVVVECYKKMILLSLIHSGQAVQLPKFTSEAVSRRVTRIARDYNNFVVVFEKDGGDAESLLKHIAENSALLEQDHNMGLAKQVLKAVQQQKISQLTNAYITLSLQDIATASGLPSPLEAEKSIVGMVADGKIYAKIDQSTGMVQFEEDAEEFDSATTVEKLEEEIQSTIHLAQRIRDLDSAISTNPHYIQKDPSRKVAVSSGGVSSWADVEMTEYATMI